WLFLARHAGLPTRLLDWSESALIALYFALKEPKPVVWMLNPLDLNDLSYSAPSQIRPRQFPLPWHHPGPRQISPAFENLRTASSSAPPGSAAAPAPPMAQGRLLFVLGGKPVNRSYLSGHLEAFTPRAYRP